MPQEPIPSSLQDPRTDAGAAVLRAARVALGALQLFVFALGMGVLFLVVGTFSAALPRSGD